MMTQQGYSVRAIGAMKRLMIAGVATACSVGAALANGIPQPWQLNLQPPNGENARFMTWFHDWLLVMCFVVSAFVLALLIYVMVRFRESKNPVPTRTTHNATLEVVWTIVPVLILAMIALPSFKLLKFQLETPVADVTIKATGKQWYWSYEYAQDTGALGFDSLMVAEEEWKKGVVDKKIDPVTQPKQLAVDNEVVVPIGKVVKIQVTAADVIHKFALPAMGLKIDAIPGRLNETWFKADREGIFYGQCSFICGQNHAYMPIAVRVVSEQAYAAWLADAKKKFAAADQAGPRVAQIRD
jgi:cytochrome c oxidase subunit 2